MDSNFDIALAHRGVLAPVPRSLLHPLVEHRQGQPRHLPHLKTIPRSQDLHLFVPALLPEDTGEKATAVQYID